MKNLLFLAFCLLALASCKNSGSTDTTAAAADSTAVATETPAAPQAACYIRADGQDTTSASITVAADGTVSGTYDWAPWEKDGAHGTLSGKKEGDMLHVTYDYVIEGSNQQEQMMFKMTGEQLAEAQGELVDEGGVLKLKDPANVKYLTFQKVACK
ncbi:MAG: hypothetical protein HY842_00315 [Bacteroidetes bacterium]|nr:hypothetical protein [Bacteroidota bacterium]